jgi:hypothetical protein
VSGRERGSNEEDWKAGRGRGEDERGRERGREKVGVSRRIEKSVMAKTKDSETRR